MKKFELPCFFNGRKSMVAVYIGNPEPSHNPIQFQVDWLSKERGGQIPPQIVESLVKIQKLAKDNNIDFAELCHHALDAANTELRRQEGAINYNAPAETTATPDLAVEEAPVAAAKESPAEAVGAPNLETKN